MSKLVLLASAGIWSDTSTAKHSSLRLVWFLMIIKKEKAVHTHNSSCAFSHTTGWSECQVVHHFSPDLNVMTTIGWIATDFGTDIHYSQMMNLNGFIDHKVKLFFDKSVSHIWGTIFLLTFLNARTTCMNKC